MRAVILTVAGLAQVNVMCEFCGEAVRVSDLLLLVVNLPAPTGGELEVSGCTALAHEIGVVGIFALSERHIVEWVLVGGGTRATKRLREH